MTLQLAADDVQLARVIDTVRHTMESELAVVQDRCMDYLNWYSPPWNDDIHRHDSWEEPVNKRTDTGLTRNNFPIARACVEIWSALEASSPPTVRAEAERFAPPAPSLDADQTMRDNQLYDLQRTVESTKADIRSARLRRYMRRDKFALKHHTAVRRKNLYGFGWQKVLPHPYEKRPYSHVIRDPTTVYPLWSTQEPDELDGILVAYQESAVMANMKYGLGLDFTDTGAVRFDRGGDDGRFRAVNDRLYNDSRTMVWVEEFWWVERPAHFDRTEERPTVHMVTRVLGRVVDHQPFKWRRVPFVHWLNADERAGHYGWSEVASVMDLNDEINRRLSQEGDIIGMYAAPRFQLLGGSPSREVELPGPFEKVDLEEDERIEQLLVRIDAFPSQVHFNFLMDEILPRVTGLPPIVWGLIANAQTSGRALTASWKSTETRLAPKLMRNEQSLDTYLGIMLDYAHLYDWQGARTVFEGLDGEQFQDFRWNFPPMEPRDFAEVTQDAIFRRDAHLTTTVKAIRDTGEEDAEELLEEIEAELQNVLLHPDVKQAQILAQQAELQLAQMEQQLNTPQPAPPAPGAGPTPPQQQTPGAPPPGAAAGAGLPPIQTSTMVQNGEVSNRFIQQGQIGGPPGGQ